jgi:hypothetical protein
MKFAILSSLLFATIHAGATPISALAAQKLKSQYQISAPLSGTTPTPIRKAILKIRIQKSIWQRDAQGVYGQVDTDVCVKTVPVNVYDMRQGNGDMVDVPDFNLVLCNSTLKQQNVTVHAGGWMALLKGLFIQNEETLKIAFPTLFLTTTEGGNVAADNLSVVGALGSNDLNAKSFVSQVSPGSQLICTTPDAGSAAGACAPTISEYFSAFVEFED